MWNGQILLRDRAKILIYQLLNFESFLVKNDYSLVTIIYSISHLQLTIRKRQVWFKFNWRNFNISISKFWLFWVKNDH